MPEESLYVLKLRHDRPASRVTLEELRHQQRWEFASLEACLSFISQRHAVTATLEGQSSALSQGDEIEKGDPLDGSP